MSLSLRYKSEGSYSAHLESGEIIITPEEIYRLVKDLVGLEKIPTIVEDFEFGKCWIKTTADLAVAQRRIEDCKEKDNFKKLIEDELENLVDKTICKCQATAKEFYKKNYILIEG